MLKANIKIKYMNQKFHWIEQFNLLINWQKYFEMVNKVQFRSKLMKREQKSAWNSLKMVKVEATNYPAMLELNI